MKIILLLIPLLLLTLPMMLTTPGDRMARRESPPMADVPPDVGVKPAIHWELIPDGEEGSVKSLAFSPDGRVLTAANMSGMVRYYDSATALKRSSYRTQESVKGGIATLAYAPDGKALAAGIGLGSVALLDAATGHRLLTLEMPSAPNRSGTAALAFSPDGKTVAAGDNSGEVVLWDAATGRRRAVLPPHIIPEHTSAGPPELRKVTRAHPARINDLAFSPDGLTLVSAVNRDTYVRSPVRFWDPAAGRERPAPIEIDGARSVAYAPDGKTLAITTGNADIFHPRNSVVLYDTATWRRRAEVVQEQSFDRLRYLPKGEAFVTLEGEKVVWLRDAADGRPLASLRFESHCRTNCLAVSPDGRLIAAGGYSSDAMFGIIQLIETDGKTLRPWQPRREP